MSGIIKLYKAYDRGKQFAHLKLHDGGDRITLIRPQPYHQAPGARFYSMTAKRHGVALIISNEHFKAHGDREGTDRDEHNLIETFLFLGYRPIVCHDLTSAEIHCIFGNLDAFLTNCDSKATAKVKNDSFVCCVLSHFDRGSIIGSDSRTLSCDKIENLVGESKTLHGKPKIFFASGSWCSTSSGHGHADGSSKGDIYVCSATVTGGQSYRDAIRGSWFFIEMCKILCEYGTCYSLFKFQSEVNEKVSQHPEYEYNARDGKVFRQQPTCSTNTLQHDVHFFHEQLLC